MREGGSQVKRYRGGRSSVTVICALGLALCLGLLLAPAPASALVAHVFKGSFATANQPSFTEAMGMAVDQSTGDVLVTDAGKRQAGEGTISRWHADGTPANFSALGSNVIKGFHFEYPEGTQVAVDNSGGPADGDIYVASQSSAVEIFDKNGNPLGQLTTYNAGPAAEGAPTAFGGSVCGVAVDPAGTLYVGEGTNGGAIHKYEPTDNPPVNGDSSANFSFLHACTLAAGAEATNGFIFPTELSLGESSGVVAKLDSTSGEEKYTVDPGPATTVTVDPANGHLFVASGNEVKEYDASKTSKATLLTSIAPGGEPVNGIAVDKASGDIYVSRKGSTQVEVWGPAVELPIATTEEATLAEGTVTLHGTVSADGGPPATCFFEYVEVHAKGFAGASSVPCAPAGPFTGTSPVSVSAQLKGLPEAAYRFRLVASNENGPNQGLANFFYSFREEGLPDARAYEMVSPAQKIGEVFPREGLGYFNSCAECLPGSTVEMMPMQSAPDGESIVYEGEPFAGGLASGGNEYLSRRSPGGWANEGLSSPLFQSNLAGYGAFSSDLSRAIVSQANPTLSPEAPTREGKGFANLYLRQGGALQALLTEEPPHRDAGSGDPSSFIVRYAGANAGTASVPPLTHVVFEANDALTQAVPGVAPAAPEVEVGLRCVQVGANCNLYEWTGGQLGLVNVLPGNAAAATGAVIGSGRLLAPPFTGSANAPDVDGAISNDGRRVFWSAESTGHVYVRVDGKETIEIPAPDLCKESVPLSERVCFQTASPDGSRVLLSNGQLFQLNETSGAYEASGDLSKGKGGFEGILGASEDLSRVYFVDRKALSDESEQNANGEHAEEGKLNLYAWDGGLTFIGKLNKLDNDLGINGVYGTWKASPSARTAQVSPDGRYLAFMSKVPLTGYDNRLSGGGRCLNSGGDAAEALPCREVFEYDATTENLLCVSCNPTGQRPLGPSSLSLTRLPNNYFPFRQPVNLPPDGQGRLFFDSQDTLSPGDENGSIQNTYEWEPNGVGSCKRAFGCVFLISSGRATEDSLFLDASANGDDAFFITRQQLALRDRDEFLDVYDARVNGGFSETETPNCAGEEACRGGLTSAPEPQSPGSASFAGPGNEKPKKHKHKKRHKHHSKKRAAKHNRGARK